MLSEFLCETQVCKDSLNDDSDEVWQHFENITFIKMFLATKIIEKTCIKGFCGALERDKCILSYTFIDAVHFNLICEVES